MTTLLVIGVVLIGIGALIGSSWTVQALEGRTRQHAAERRRLNDEWHAVRAYRAQLRRCVDCADELDRDRRPALVGGAHEDDD